MNVRVIGVSPDSVKSHVKFKAKHGFTYSLVADTDHPVCELYGVWGEKTMYGRKYWGVNRTTFIIDAGGTVARVYEKVTPDGHAVEVASFLEGRNQ